MPNLHASRRNADTVTSHQPSARYAVETERFEAHAEQSQWRTKADVPDCAWRLLVGSARRLPTARRALRAFYERERVVRMAEAKFEESARVLRMFPRSKPSCFAAAPTWLWNCRAVLAIPLISASTPASERHAILATMREGTLRAVASVKV